MTKSIDAISMSAGDYFGEGDICKYYNLKGIEYSTNLGVEQAKSGLIQKGMKIQAEVITDVRYIGSGMVILAYGTALVRKK